MLAKVRRLFNLSRELGMALSSIWDILDAVTSLPILDGQLITGQSLAFGSSNKVPHKLGRNLRGWILTDNQMNAVIWRTSSDASFITLQTSAVTTVSLWVF